MIAHAYKVLSWLLLATMLGLGTPAATLAQSEEDKQRALDHYKRGLELYREEAHEAALSEFERAYEIAPNYRVLYNIAQVQFQMKDFSAALQTFEKYLEDGRDTMSDERRAEVEKDYNVLRDRVGTVILEVNVDDAKVFVDDQPVGTTPLMPLTLNIGRHLVRIEAPGYESAVHQIRLASRDREQLDVTLQKKVVFVEKVSRARTLVRWSLGGATAGFLVGAVTAGILTLKADGDLDKALETYPSLSAKDLNKRRDRVSRTALATDIMAVGTVLTGVAFGLSMILGGSPDEETPEGVQPKMEIGLGIAPQGISLHSRF